MLEKDAVTERDAQNFSIMRFSIFHFQIFSITYSSIFSFRLVARLPLIFFFLLLLLLPSCRLINDEWRACMCLYLSSARVRPSVAIQMQFSLPRDILGVH